MSPGHQAASLSWQGDAALRVGKLEEAWRCYREASQKWAAAGYFPGIIQTTINMGVVAEAQGRARAALECLEEAEKLLKRNPNLRLLLLVRANLGSLYLGQSQHEKAALQLMEAVELAQKLGDLQREGAARLGLGALYQDQGRFQEAKLEAESVLKLAHSSMSDGLGAGAWQNLGALHQEEGDFDRADWCYGQAEGILEQKQEWGNLGSVLLGRAVLELERGRVPELGRVKEIARQLQDRWLLQSVAMVEALSEAMLKKPAEALFAAIKVDAQEHPIRAQLLKLYQAHCFLPEHPDKILKILPDGFVASAALRTAIRLLFQKLPQGEG